MNEHITWEAETQEYSADFTSGGCPEPSIAVVETVARIDETPVKRLPPLSESVDPDALDDIFSDDRRDCRMQFQYGDYLITVVDGRELRVAPPEIPVETKLVSHLSAHR